MSRARTAIVVGITPLLLSGALLLTAAAHPVTPLSNSHGTAEEARAWVKANRNSIPTTLNGIAGYSTAYRKAIYDVLTPAQKAALWRENVETYLRPPGELSQVQRRMVAELDGALTDAQKAMLRATADSIAILFDPTLTRAQQAPLAGRLCARAKAAFSKRNAVLIIGKLGPIDSADLQVSHQPAAAPVNQAGMITGFVNAVHRLAVSTGIIRQPANECTCNQSSICSCYPRSQYCTGYPMCAMPTNTYDCGCFYWFQCNGSCQ